ncbi:Cof-type HAD-IIB family hydrolase [Jeotgalibacillus proteolyticus]|uniref:Cof-type HAD-IIB family hydrolase n=1 Tax=Jeotgalibacillus proteolyticus TaxID=2082395 RepID=UPI003CEC2831
MSSKKIIFFDIDGTLLDHDKKLPASTKDAISRLKANGHYVAIATGRAPFMFEDLRRELSIDTFISYNGQYVEHNGEMIVSNPLHYDSLKQLTESAAVKNHPLVYMGKSEMKANVEEHDRITASFNSLKIKSFPTHDPSYFHMEEIYQTLLFCEGNEEEAYDEKFEHFDFIRWHPQSVDVIPAGGSKAKGIEKVIEVLSLNMENVYAFGDGLNDIEMLASVGHGIAMGNGCNEAKEAADFTTAAVDKDGIAEGLKRAGLL